jgi:radical SAM superfamily enzyme YgiQ (UPF0313 family)
MRVGIVSVYVDPNRRGADHRGALQPQVGPLIAALLPPDAEIEIVLDTWREPDWARDYDLLFISSLHSDFDRARQISHYWRCRGARTVFGGILASTYAALCKPFFDAVVIGDAEGAVRQVYRDAARGQLQPFYLSRAYDPDRVPVPRLDLAVTQNLVPHALEVTRGCPFTCDFCALTAIGTRFHTRAPELVVRDIREGKRMLKGRTPSYMVPTLCFMDNNIGGNPKYLARFCEAITPLRIWWGAAITFNCVTDPAAVEMLARAGCRLLFMGLESFNPDTLSDMGKFQNELDRTRRVLDLCRRHGIIVTSGLMLSPTVDTAAYIETIPERLRECGLHLPTFISFESPFPGTPHFDKLTGRQPPALLPNALLRDFTGYTLVVQPTHATPETFVDLYKSAIAGTFTKRAKIRKLCDDLPRFLRDGHWESAAVDLIHQCTAAHQVPDPHRTYLAGSDRPPPEAARVPLTASDFESEADYHAVMDPWRVTDARGHILAGWAQPRRVFDRAGRVSPDAVPVTVTI